MESFLLNLVKHLNLVARASDIPCILKKGEFGEFLSCIEKTYTKLKGKKTMAMFLESNNYGVRYTVAATW